MSFGWISFIWLAFGQKKCSNHPNKSPKCSQNSFPKHPNNRFFSNMFGFRHPLSVAQRPTQTCNNSSASLPKFQGVGGRGRQPLNNSINILISQQESKSNSRSQTCCLASSGSVLGAPKPGQLPESPSRSPFKSPSRFSSLVEVLVTSNGLIEVLDCTGIILQVLLGNGPENPQICLATADFCSDAVCSFCQTWSLIFRA